MREIEVRAAREDRKLKDLVSDLLRKGLAALERGANGQKSYRVKLSLIQSSHPAAPGEELTPERIHEILLEQEVKLTGAKSDCLSCGFKRLDRTNRF